MQVPDQILWMGDSRHFEAELGTADAPERQGAHTLHRPGGMPRSCCSPARRVARGRLAPEAGMIPALNNGNPESTPS